MKRPSPVRVINYVRTMFPLPAHAGIGAALFLSLYLSLQALAGITPLQLGPAATLGVASTVLWMFLIRVEDDITDAPHDIRLAAQQDSRYTARPVVTGAITVAELRTLFWWGAAVLLSANAVLAFGWTFAACAVGCIISWFGFRWFFIPALVRHPSPLKYLYRKVLTVLFGIYAAAMFADEFGGGIGLLLIPLLIAPCAAVATWETARKLRAPCDETAYATYSKALGYRVAGLLPPAFAAVSLACLAYVAHSAKLPWIYVATVGAATLGLTVASVRFVLAPSQSASARLGPLAQLFGAVAHGGLVIALVVERGVLLAW